LEKQKTRTAAGPRLLTSKSERNVTKKAFWSGRSDVAVVVAMVVGGDFLLYEHDDSHFCM